MTETEDERFARRPMGMRMAMVVRQWRGIIDRAIVDTGLTQSGWTVLMQLHQTGDNVSVSELAQTQGIELPPLMRTLSQLEAQGYLLRTTSPYDKRIRLLTLTSAGKEILEKISQVVEIYQNRVSQNISALDMEQFSETLNNIARNLRILRGEDCQNAKSPS
jgi:DNA-binding MarR family transcriptional regulator